MQSLYAHHSKGLPTGWRRLTGARGSPRCYWFVSECTLRLNLECFVDGGGIKFLNIFGFIKQEFVFSVSIILMFHYIFCRYVGVDRVDINIVCTLRK